MAKPSAVFPVLQLRLYVAGNGPNSSQARANISSLCHEQFFDAFELEIIDLLEFPLRAVADGIIVTPTLLKLAPSPVQRIIGNLSDASQVLFTLRSP